MVGCYTIAEPHSTCPATCSRPNEMGTITDPASALRNSEFQVETDVSRSLRTEDKISATTIALRYGGDTITAFGSWGIGLHNVGDVGSSKLNFTSANFITGVGYRARTAKMGGLYRRGLGIRTEVGIDTYDDSSVDTDADVAMRKPFDLLRFTPGQYFQSLVEARYELVGCHAPFIHIELGLRGRKDTEPSTLSFPLGISIGAHPGKWGTVFAEYALLVGRAPDIHSEVRPQTRTRVGIEIGPSTNKHVPVVGFDVAFVSGPFTSAQATATVTFPLRWGQTPSTTGEKHAD